MSAGPRTAQLTAAIATCERPQSLMRCLDAILGGDVLPEQVVIVDQGNDDGLGRLLAARSADPVRIEYVRQPRLGLAASRNRALTQSTHQVIAFTDDDCVPHPAWVAVAERLLGVDDPIAALAGRVLPLGPETPDTWPVSLRQSTVPQDYRGRHPPWNVGTGGNLVAKRRWLDRVEGFDERLGAGSPGKAAEDADLLYRLLRAGATVRFEPDAVVFHERQGRAQRLASRTTYGFGIGAFAGLWLARGDPYPGLLLASWVLRQTRGLAQSAAKRDGFLLRQRASGLAGAARGLGHGLVEAARAGIARRRPA